MQARISRWGNSLAIRIPTTFAHEIKVQDGTPVEITVQDGRLQITPLRPALILADLLAGVTDENIHNETEWGGSAGAESW